MSSSIIRALSPGLAAIHQTLTGHDDEDKALARHLALSGANSVDEILELIPSDYRTVLADPLRHCAGHVEKLHAAITTLTKWESHLAAGTLPAHLRTSAPKVQFSAVYVNDAEAKAAEARLATSHAEYQKSVLTESIKQKKDEVTFMKKALEPQQMWTELQARIAPHATQVLGRSKLPVVQYDNDGTVVGTTLEIPRAAEVIRDNVMNDCVVYAQRVISITTARVELMAQKIQKKRDVAAAATSAAADVTMADTTATVASLVQKEVKRVLMGTIPKESKRKGKPSLFKQAKVSQTRSTFEGVADYFLESSGSRPGQVLRRAEEVRCQSTASTQTDSRLWKASPRSGWETSQRQASDGWTSSVGESSTAAAETAAAEAERQRKEEVVELVSTIASNHKARQYHTGSSEPFIEIGELWIARPKIMPDEILELPVPTAVNIILSNCSLQWLNDARFQQYVHQSPGTHVPQNISYMLSVGAKYMFHQPTNAKLLTKSWHDFQRRLRWRIHFMFNPSTQAYDPDFDVRPPSNKPAPKLPQYIELGLVRGRIFVNKMISKVPDALTEGTTTVTPPVKAIREFLTSNDYIVTGTDKNLGIAVSRRDWIVQKCQDCLDSANDYRKLQHDEVISILDHKCNDMRELAKLAKDYLDHVEGTVSDFMRSKITLRGEAHHIPRFYGIPKIHKVPTKMRPIIPCHSAIMNPAAKYVSKKLKPLITAANTVIHGTKDLAIKLSKLNIDPKRKWYIVTGDVVAFYPNIPLQRCIDIVFDQYMEHYWSIPTHDDPLNRKQQYFFKRCLEVGNTKLITQFQGEVYEQLNGLAMGVADSPDLSNLFGYYFEKKSAVLDHPSIFFYGRYIDDCLAIVYAEDSQSAVNLLSNLIRFDNCVIEWNASGMSQPFLDMLLYKDEHNKLQYMPYRKSGNHQERIPWISAHPYDVKRGTFLGEMSRLATLSSKYEHYLEAMRGLVALYIHRGYPTVEVHKWLHTNLQERWTKRLDCGQKAPDADVLVLKTQYNLAWNYFNAYEFGQTIFDYWREWLRRADSGEFSIDYPAPPRDESASATAWDLNDLRDTSIFNSRVILSRKRTRNLLDLTNLWKKTVLENLEQDHVLEDLVINAAQYTAHPKRPHDFDVNTQVVGPRPMKRTREDADTEIQLHIRSSPPVAESWSSGAASTWGRGSNR
jgi:hypothetical protein